MSTESPTDVPTAGPPVITRTANRAKGDRNRVRRISWTYADSLPSTRAFTSKSCSTRDAAGAKSNVTAIQRPVTHQRRWTTTAAIPPSTSGWRGGSKLLGVESVGSIVVTLRRAESAAPVRFIDQRPNPPIIVVRPTCDGFCQEGIHHAARAMCRVYANRSNDRGQFASALEHWPVFLERELVRVDACTARGLRNEWRILRIDQNEPNDVAFGSANEKARSRIESFGHALGVSAHEGDERLRSEREVLGKDGVGELLELENVVAPCLRVEGLELVASCNHTVANALFGRNANRSSCADLADVTSGDV